MHLPEGFKDDGNWYADSTNTNTVAGTPISGNRDSNYRKLTPILEKEIHKYQEKIKGENLFEWVEFIDPFNSYVPYEFIDAGIECNNTNIDDDFTKTKFTCNVGNNKADLSKIQKKSVSWALDNK